MMTLPSSASTTVTTATCDADGAPAMVVDVVVAVDAASVVDVATTPGTVVTAVTGRAEGWSDGCCALVAAGEEFSETCPTLATLREGRVCSVPDRTSANARGPRHPTAAAPMASLITNWLVQRDGSAPDISPSLAPDAHREDTRQTVGIDRLAPDAENLRFWRAL